MTDYARLAAQLNTVRRAWKRRTALAGFAMVLLESLAVFTLILLVDWLYQPALLVRVALFALALGAVAALLARHVLVPLFRKIPDEQLALYVEEHRKDFEGALMTAAEFGRGDRATPEQAGMIAAVVDEAAARASRVNLPGVVDLRRLRKYGLAAAILLVVYAGMCVLFPQTVGHHAARVLTPWRPTPEDLGVSGEGVTPAARPFQEAMKLPIQFTLSKGDTRLPRGGEFALEATLSRPADGPVVLRFRAAADGEKAPWRELPMKEVDRLNGFAAALKDVNEEMQFCVTSGRYASQIHRISVYDPLVVEGLEVTTRFPAYLKLPDRVEPGQGGDVAAPIGSTVTLRLRANNALASGALRWQDGPEQGLSIGDPKTWASASFEVQKDASYTFVVRDTDGQELASTVPFAVRALKDQPPRVEVKSPRIDIATHPLGQITVEAEAGDDFGVEGVDLVYQVASDAGPPEVRMPLKAKPLPPVQNPDGKTVGGTVLLAMEDFRPHLAPGALLTYYVESRDQKGQKAASDIYMVTVTPFEEWATWGIESTEIAEAGVMPSPLSVILAAVWHLHTQKETLPPEEFGKQSEELARTMVHPTTGEVFPFVNMKKVPPEKIERAKRIPELAKKAHAALLKHDTAKAVEYLRLGVAELAFLGLSESPTLMAKGSSPIGAPEPMPDSALAQIATFTLEAVAEGVPAGGAVGPVELIAPGYRRELKKAEEAEKLKKKAEELKKDEQNVLDRALAMASKGGEQQPGDQQGAQQAGGQQGGAQAGGQQGGQQAGGQGGGGDSPQVLAGDQRKLAARAKETAMDAKAAAGLDPNFGKMGDKMNDAARDMFAAADKMQKGDMDRALADVKRAQDNILEAVKSVQSLQMHSLEQALDLAQAHAERLLRDQVEIRSGTRAVAGKMGPAAKPDPAQQRDLKGLAFRQGETRVNMERLKEEVGALREWILKGVKAETARGIEDANRGIERHQIVQKMTNAAVELDGLRASSAADEQAKAETGLQVVVDKLREAAGTLASDYKSELARAKFEADRVAAALEQLGGKVGGAQSGGRQTGGQGGQQAGGQQAGGQQGGQQTGGQQGGQQAGGQQAGGQQGGQQAGGQQGGGQTGGPLSGEAQRELSHRAASDLASLTRHLESRRLAAEEAGEIRKVLDDPNTLAKVLAADEAKREELLGVVRKVGNKLMAELEAKLQAERLKDFQREECPPQYRPLVNKYYELLSQTSAQPEAGR